jgi:Protein of unknown function (DUF2975)
MKSSTALPLAWITLRILIALNWLSGIAIFALLTATVVAEEWTFTALGIKPEDPIRPIIMGLRGVAALGIVAVVLNNNVLTRLQKIVETVRHGDAFIRDNAYRLNAIAWLVLALQLVSIAIAAIGKLLSTPKYPLEFDAGFSPTSWLCVLLLFVLARVFAEGTLMREDLEGTI